MTASELHVRVSTDHGKSTDFRLEARLARDLIAQGLDATSTVPSSGDGTKGELVGLVLKVVEGTLGKSIEAISAFFSRPGAPPVEIELEIKDRKAKIKFDPKNISQRDLNAVIQTLSIATRSK